ncbi:hypothetical protein [Sorangium cellulosum]|uniref:hypothetical protein n=1 Tax=Sorangium cellulosum TaxID=56 RepID=UPI0004203CB8|nr:hypothetical protein [Sorangium cellulosum]
MHANHLCFENQVRLSGLIKEVGGHCEPRLLAGKRCPIDYTPRHMHFAPAGMSIWGYSPDLRYLKHITLVFNVRALEERVGERFSTEAASTPLQAVHSRTSIASVRRKSSARFVDRSIAATLAFRSGVIVRLRRLFWLRRARSDALAHGLAEASTPAYLTV